MRYTFAWLCLALAACSSPPKREPEAMKPVAVQPSTEAVMQRLLAEIEQPGRQYEIDPSAFFARPDSLTTLVSAYESSDGAWTRWKLLRLARKTRSSEVQAFLKTEAMKPVARQAKATPSGMATTVGNVEMANRLEAALGVLDYMPGSERDIEEIIATADAAISRVVASELSGRGLLTDSLISALQAHGLPTEFRDLSESEERALMAVEWRKEAQP